MMGPRVVNQYGQAVAIPPTPGYPAPAPTEGPEQRHIELPPMGAIYPAAQDPEEAFELIMGGLYQMVRRLMGLPEQSA